MTRNRMLGCAFAVLMTATGVSAADPTVTAILADWKARQTKVKTARYEVSGKSERLDLDPGNPQPVNMIVVIDLEKKRFRIEKRTRSPVAENPNAREDAKAPQHTTFVEEQTIQSYDGKKHYMYIPRDKNTLSAGNPNLFISTGNLTTLAYHQEIWPILEAHGIIPLAKTVARPDKLPLDHDPESLYEHGEVNHVGRKCVLLKSNPPNAADVMADEFYVDRERTSAIIRHIYYGNKKPWIRLDIMHTSSSFGWIPSKWIYNQYLSSGKLGQIVSYVVDKTAFDERVKDEDFVIAAKSGDLVMENVYPEAGHGLKPHIPASTTSKIDEKGGSVRVSETGYTTAEGQILPPERTAWHYWLLAITVIVIGGGVFLWRRRAKHSSAG